MRPKNEPGVSRLLLDITLYLLSVGQFHWLGVLMKGRLFLIQKVGRVGDCIRP